MDPHSQATGQRDEVGAPPDEPPPTAFGSDKKHFVWEIGLVVVVLALLVGGVWWGGGALAEWAAGKLPYSIDQRVGAAAAEQQLSGADVCDNPALTGAVQAIVDRLATGLEPELRELHVNVIGSDMVNAFALPGGHIFVLTGLLEKLESPEELIGVLGHEIGHVAHRHGVKRIARSVWLRFLLAYFFGDVGTSGELFVQGASEMVGLKFDRDQERESDVFGLELMTRTGIRPGRFPDFFTRLPGGSMPDWFLTHPDPEDRADELRERIAAMAEIANPWQPPSLDALQSPCHAGAPAQSP